MNVRASLHLLLPVGSGAAPDWVHVLPAGTFSGIDGRGPFVVEDVDDVIRASMAAGKLALDENHSTDLAGKLGQSAPARGWIVELQKRDDGVWARVEWTKAGRELMEDRAYRGISPVFLSREKDGRVLQLLRAALTNDPNLPLTSLHSTQDRSPDMDVTKLRAALGLKPEATDADIIAAATSLHAAAAAAAADRVALAKAAGLADDAKVDDVVAVLAQRSAGDPAHESQLRATVTALQTQLMQFTASAARDKAVAFVDGAIKSGKPILPLRDHYIERHVKDAPGVEKEIGAMVSIHAGAIVPPRDANGGSDALDAQEHGVVALMGLDPKKFAEQRAKLAERR